MDRKAVDFALRSLENASIEVEILEVEHGLPTGDLVGRIDQVRHDLIALYFKENPAYGGDNGRKNDL